MRCRNYDTGDANEFGNCTGVQIANGSGVFVGIESDLTIWDAAPVTMIRVHFSGGKKNLL